MLHNLVGYPYRYIFFLIQRTVPYIGKVGLLIVFLMLSVTAYSHDTQRYDFQIITADDTDTTKNIVENLRKKFPTAHVIGDPTKRRQKTKNTIAIVVGPSALRTVLLQNGEDIIFSIFTSSQSYRSILDTIPGAYSDTITAIYADPSPGVQFRLISSIYKKKVNVATILSNKTSYLEPILQRVAAQNKTHLNIENYTTGENLNRILNRLTEYSVILAIPDSTVYNSDNIRNILMTTYRHNQAVIGFSAPLVKAGALASSYSDIEDICAQLDELVSDFEVTGKLSEPQFPKYYSVVVNEDVARSLNLVIDDSVKDLSRKPTVRKP